MDHDEEHNVNDSERLVTSRQVDPLENDLRSSFDQVTRLAAKLLRTPIALVSLVDAEHQFLNNSSGIPSGWTARRESELALMLCQHVIASATPLIIDDVRRHPLVNGDPPIAEHGGLAYAGVPLLTDDGPVRGALYVVDTTSRAWTGEEIDILHELAALVMTQIKLRMDIAAREHVEASLAMQYDVTRMLVEAEDLASAAAGILQIIGKTLGWEVGLLWLVNEHHEVLQCQQVWKTSEQKGGAFAAASRSMTFRSGAGLPGRVWASGQAMWIGNVLADNNFPRLAIAVQEGLHSAFGFPARGSGGIVGVVEFFSAKIRPPDDELLALVTALGHQIGQFIERQQTQADLRNSEARKAAILASALDCVISMDHLGRITEFNPAAERTFGYQREDVLGQEMASLIVPVHLREPHRRGLKHYLATGEGPVLAKRIELSALRADGTEFPIELTITRIPLDGPPMFTGYIRDITEQKRAEQERIELLQRERAAREEAERAVHTRDEFLSIAAHELKTPITALRGYTELLQRRLAPEQTGRTARALQVLQEQSQRLARLIEQLLDVSRIATGHFTLTLAPLELCQLVQRVVEAVEPTLERHSLTIHCEAEMLVIDGDELRLEQVVRNLLDNAIKYSPSGGSINIWIGRQGQDAVLTISDQGIGIPPSAQSQLFQRFYRADNVEGSPMSGFGIGLYVVHEVVSRHGGMITVSSVEGEGSTFVVRLPLGLNQPAKSNITST